MKPLSWDATWTDTVALARRGLDDVLIIAGVFLLLPTLAMELWLDPPVIARFDWDAVVKLNRFLIDNAPLLLSATLVGWFGSAALYRLLLDRRMPTVGDALKAAAIAFLVVALVNWLAGLVVMAGLIAFIVPGIYLIGRLAVALPAAMAEDIGNPLNAINRSLELTRGNGWRVAGLIVVVTLVTQIVGAAVRFVLGIPLAALSSGDVEHDLLALLAGTISTAEGLLLILLSAAIYRQLNATSRPAASS